MAAGAPFLPLLPYLPSQLRVLDGKSFDAGEEDVIEALLPCETTVRVVVKPPHDRKHQASLEEDEERTDHRTMTGERQRSDSPVVVTVKEVGQEERAATACGKRTPQQCVHALVNRGIFVVAGRATGESASPPRPPDIVFDLVHQVVDGDVRRARVGWHYRVFGVKVSPSMAAINLTPSYLQLPAGIVSLLKRGNGSSRIASS